MNRWMPFVSLVLAAVTAVPAAAQCPAMNVANVTVVVRTGTPPADEGDRREHIRVTQAVATALCIDPLTVSPNGDRSPQVRVEITTDPTTTSTVRSSAVFTVSSIDATAATGNLMRVEVWNRRTTTDKDNGLIKLFPAFSSTKPITGNAATVYRIAPSRTSNVTYGVNASNETSRTNTVPATQHYNEPSTNGTRRLEEFVQTGALHNLAVIMPHGGDIETDISRQLWRVDQAIDNIATQQADIWEAFGTWGNSETFRRWHITSSALSPLSFPGLAPLIDQAAVTPYDYAAAIHGFTGRTTTSSDTSGAFKGIVIGGQSSRDEKCYIATQIQDLYGARTSEVALTFFFEVGGVLQTLEVPALQSGKLEYLLDVDDLRGMEDDNVVNRLSPNPDALAGQGAFQFELSKELRSDATLLASTMQGIGSGLARLFNNPAVAVGACNNLDVPTLP